ncbi:MAG: hypothetical protein B7733_10305 [Myxococcales bacterium FL481]|nr:MAG: hypothetical protein B7733_10305 [Myxococcales bacterium FL481]
MPTDKDRFRRLATSGSLFEHFDVPERAPTTDDAEPAQIVDAVPCRGCGWYQTGLSCPVCGRDGAAPA